MSSLQEGPRAPEIDHANTELRFAMDQLRSSVSRTSAIYYAGSLNYAFRASERRDQAVSFSFGSSHYVVNSPEQVIIAGGVVFGGDDRRLMNGAKKATGVFRRFDVLEITQDIPASGRTLNVTETCLVCEGESYPDHPEVVSEVYYPVVNLGDEGLSFSG